MTDPATPLVVSDIERPFTFTTTGCGGPAGGRGGTDHRERTKMSVRYARVSGTGTEGGTPLNAVGGDSDGQ
ncbi:hypothetical protein G9463_11040 [Haloarcula sp. JP-Z28]|uniref:hypothetical protein n=1 Tax=Haloarcula sp. JP-Z28 TaxID=2716715 RepID=UPI00140433BB|nr:hypothetical protein [Haloarcula sp. JP-Z28]NHN63829.1 hypothetical protein [Haloarcula sp. JP-Z28]